MERLFDHVGHFGRFQAYLYFMSVFQAVSCGIHYLASVFMTVTPKFICNVPGNISTVLLPNTSTSGPDNFWELWTSSKDDLVIQLENGDVWEVNRCSRFKREAFNLTYAYEGNKTLLSCSSGFLYDHTHLLSSVVTEWDLVCDREWLAKLVQPTFMFGVLLGAVIFGDIADRVGRRPIMWFTSTGQFLFGVAVAFTFDYYSFVIVRFFLAMVSSGYLVVVFVYVTEYVGIKGRTWASMHVHAAFAVGIMVVALVGFLVHTWWIYQLILSLATLPFIFCCWTLPETPFWLHSQGKYKEVEKIIAKMERWNKVRGAPCKLSELCSVKNDSKADESEVSTLKAHNVFDLFHNWTFARRTISVWLIWFTGSFGYYVFSLSSVNLGGNEYLNLFLSGAVEIPSYIIACLGMDKLGRRNTLAPFLILSAIICGVIMLIPQNLSTITIIMSMAGKFSIGVAFGLIYLYTAELYPTTVRSLAVGSGSMMCRIGSVVAPFCVYLTEVWIFMPQMLVGIMALLTGILTLLLPETLGRPLSNSMEEAVEMAAKNGITKKKATTELNGTVMEKLEPMSPDNLNA
ncbi:solute carrier family 22 member 16 isoform X2 [Spea bombifrons]|uniref:solute carrier family 22 member 16 isoform X2 n=1 Tax=Spea bombifrons TaxID=233779 RepID=UPI0023498886|nr:solute carrier family 22 member 16 isoform X2 [Spea bombifrons]